MTPTLGSIRRRKRRIYKDTRSCAWFSFSSIIHCYLRLPFYWWLPYYLNTEDSVISCIISRTFVNPVLSPPFSPSMAIAKKMTSPAAISHWRNHWSSRRTLRSYPILDREEKRGKSHRMMQRATFPPLPIRPSNRSAFWTLKILFSSSCCCRAIIISDWLLFSPSYPFLCVRWRKKNPNIPEKKKKKYNQFWP